MKTYDLVIVGGGVCGMTAAIYAARANLSTCILEKDVCGGLVNWTHTVENFPSHKSIHGMELMALCREQVEALGVSIEEVEDVERVDFSGSEKRLFTSSGEEYGAGAVIVATGRKPRPLPVQTSFERVHYCSVCDGAPYKGKHVIVVGGGNSGFDESLYLIGLGVNHVHIVEAFPSCIAAASTQDRARESGRIGVSVSTEIVSVDTLPDGRGRVLLKNTATGEESSEETDGIFCFIGQSPNTKAFEGVLEMTDGYIRVNGDMETGIAGVYAAGDVIVKKWRQITTAMGDATIAALQAEKYLRSMK